MQSHVTIDATNTPSRNENRILIALHMIWVLMSVITYTIVLPTWSAPSATPPLKMGHVDLFSRPSRFLVKAKRQLMCMPTRETMSVSSLTTAYRLGYSIVAIASTTLLSDRVDPSPIRCMCRVKMPQPMWSKHCRSHHAQLPVISANYARSNEFVMLKN